MRARTWWWVAGAGLASIGMLAGCGGGDDDSGNADANGSGTGGKSAAMQAQAGGAGGAQAGSAASAGTGGKRGGSGGASRSGSGGSGGTRPVVTGSPSARELAKRLGRTHFMIGMGNDLDNDHDKDGAYTLGVTMDTHDAYLVGLQGMGGWTDWNDNGSFANILADSAKRHGTVPMFTLYSMAAWGESNTDVLVNDDYMKPYWAGAKLLYQRIAEFGDPAIVHIEPDFWAFMQHQGDPSGVPVHVTSLIDDCADQPDNLIGLGKCLIALGRKYAPKAVIGLHASRWADSDPANVAAYLMKVGGDADFIGMDMLDRDAGCFEAHVDPNCQRDDGPWYWDETNQTSPNFHEYLAWAKGVSAGMQRPIVWWQVPFGVPSDTPGGTAGHYRDNRVKYVFEHIDELISAGGAGVSFGTGAGNQTYITTDGDQFKNAVTGYFASPVEL